jgi:DNA-binding NarL/FixJ family response regulator
MEVVAEASVGISAVQTLCEYLPDIGLIDPRMPGLEGGEIVRRIRDAVPDAKLIIISSFDMDEDIVLTLKAGARAYLLKDIAPSELISSIREVLVGKTLVSPRVASKLAAHVAQVRPTLYIRA